MKCNTALFLVILGSLFMFLWLMNGQEHRVEQAYIRGQNHIINELYKEYEKGVTHE